VTFRGPHWLGELRAPRLVDGQRRLCRYPASIARCADWPWGFRRLLESVPSRGGGCLTVGWGFQENLENDYVELLCELTI
jgi:hypothetical protein